MGENAQSSRVVDVTSQPCARRHQQVELSTADGKVDSTGCQPI